MLTSSDGLFVPVESETSRSVASLSLTWDGVRGCLVLGPGGVEWGTLGDDVRIKYSGDVRDGGLRCRGVRLSDWT